MKMPRAGTLNPDRMLESSEEFKNTQLNFTGGSGVRNLPDDAGDTDDAGDMGSIPAPGGFHMLRGSKAQALQLQVLEPVLPNERRHETRSQSAATKTQQSQN